MSAKLSRYQTTEYNRARRILSKLRDIYSCARSFHSSHAEILVKLREVYATSDYKKLTPYYLGQATATRECLSDELYRSHLEWRLYLDGKLVKSKDVPKGRWSDVKGGEHVWSNAPDKLFSTSEGKD